MEGDAGARRLNPDDPSAPADDDAERREAEEKANLASADDDAERREAEEKANLASADDDAERREAEEKANHGPDLPSRLNSRGWFVGVCAALLVLGAAITTGGYFALRAHQEAVDVAGAESLATQAAKDCVAATQAPNTAAMAESQQKIIECATGDYSVQATLYSGVLLEAYQAANAQVQVTDMRAAVERHNDDGSMDVLVALRVKLSNSDVQEQETGYRLRVQMAPQDGTYKIARLDQVTT
jgi:Mce-associated membrane protein